MYHLPTTTLRYYEDLGLLFNVARQGNRRVYNEQHLARLSAICCFKNTGMTLSELQALFGYDKHGNGLNQIIALLDRHDKEVDQKLKLLEQNHQQIKRKLHFYQDIRTAEQAGSPSPDWADYRSKIF